MVRGGESRLRAFYSREVKKERKKGRERERRRKRE